MAGPFAAMLLGDLGADVIKIESPGTGDQARRSMGFRLKGEDSPGFLALNRNKRSMAVNLQTAAGRTVLHRLVAGADILIENNRPGVTQRLGADYATLSAINPRLIYASISGFGQNGPWAGRPGFDLIAQAMSGIVSATGHPGAAPAKSSIPVGDLGAGLFATYAVLAAVIGRGATGRGQHIDTSLFDAAVALSIWESAEYWATGQPPGPIGTANRMSAPYQAFAASDGHFVVAAANQKLWLAFCKVVGRPELATDRRFGDNAARVAHRLDLAELLQVTFRNRTAADWVEAFLASGIPAGPINDYAAALESDHAAARAATIEIDHPIEGRFKALGFAAKLSMTPARVRRPPPLLGEHTDDILAELGLTQDRVDLAEAGAFLP